MTLRILLTVCMLTFACLITQAQTPSHRWAVGVKGGPTFSYITRTNTQYSLEAANISSLIQGVAGGVSVQYFTESNFALQIEGIYAQKGWRQRFAVGGELRDDVYYQTTLNYLEVPVTAHGYVGRRNVRIFLDGGIYLAYLLSYNTTQTAGVIQEDIAYKISNSNANQFDLGIKGGGGFEVATRAGTFQLGAYYAWGVGSVIKKYQTTPENAAQGIPNILQNNVISITLGYFIEFGQSQEQPEK